jgi:hypothetical protein
MASLRLLAVALLQLRRRASPSTPGPSSGHSLAGRYTQGAARPVPGPIRCLLKDHGEFTRVALGFTRAIPGFAQVPRGVCSSDAGGLLRCHQGLTRVAPRFAQVRNFGPRPRRGGGATATGRHQSALRGFHERNFGISNGCGSFRRDICCGIPSGYGSVMWISLLFEVKISFGGSHRASSENTFGEGTMDTHRSTASSLEGTSAEKSRTLRISRACTLGRIPGIRISRDRC